MAYSVLIRTKNSAQTLRTVLRALIRQTVQPERILAIDSGSTDDTAAILHDFGIERIDYPPHLEFNYSRSLNLGFAHLTSPWVLSLSSHVILHDPAAVETLLRASDQHPGTIGLYAVVHTHPAPAPAPARFTRIDRHNFTGGNGLWNTCSLIRRTAWQAHPFPERPWTAEDQAWAVWHFNHSPDAATQRMEGLNIEYANPYHSPWKHVSEQISIATYAYPQGFRPLAMAKTLLRGIRQACTTRTIAGHPNLQLPLCLLLYRLKLLSFRSNYHNGPPPLVRWLFPPSTGKGTQ